MVGCSGRRRVRRWLMNGSGLEGKSGWCCCWAGKSADATGHAGFRSKQGSSVERGRSAWREECGEMDGPC